MDGDPCLLGIAFQHPGHPPDGGGQIDNLQILIGCALRAGQRQQLFRHSVQPLGFVADVTYKFPGGLQIHVVLQNGVRQQLNGGQGGFQLVRSIGDEPTALLLGILELFRQLVEFVSQDGQLIVASQVYLVGVVALPDNPHGGHDPV